MLDIVDPCVPRVQLDRADLDEPEQAGEIIYQSRVPSPPSRFSIVSV
jgi:hypothetical protein